jgi:FkbM family methyltransferase
MSLLRTNYHALRTLIRLWRQFGVREGTQVGAELLRRGDIRFPDNGRWYYIKRDPGALNHVIESTPKLRRLAEVVTPQDKLILDLGAHSGLFAAFAKERAPEALVVAVEPDPALHPVIEHNLAPFGNWQLLRKAVSGEAGTLPFYRNLSATQTGSLSESFARAFTNDVERIDVEVTTLDALMEGVEQVDVLKLDIQGAEQAVLQAADLSRVRKLIVEVTFIDGDPTELLGFLREEFGALEVLNPIVMGADLLYVRM